MPKIKIDHVISFSSEDPVHVANNILSSDPAKKWKCKSSGEISATVVLQLDKATRISGIDIGNEHSAYIEVLVTRSGASDDYKVLVVMSSFMTPLEARQRTNINKVRMFTKDQLSKPESEQKWDRVKIVCTQPFNRHVQYGLSFVTLHTIAEDVTGAPVPSTIGKFTLRPESPNQITPGSVFARRKELQKDPPSVATAIKEASNTKPRTPTNKITIKTNNSTKKTNNNDTPRPRNRNEILYSQDEEIPHKKIDEVVEKALKQRKEKSPEPQPVKRKSTTTNSSPKKKRKVVEESVTVKKPFSELLKDVILVISGIQNPDRANLRTQALEMGAKYKADWDSTCTHLICAFTNTPKFNQVKGKGKIVKKIWVEECHTQRKRLPWRRFCLDKTDGKQPESEDEICEAEEPQVPEIEEIDDSDTDEGFDDTEMQKKIEEIQAKNVKDAGESSRNVYSLDTEDEDFSLGEVQGDLPNIPGFFALKTFFIDEALDEDVVKMMKRYIFSHDGIITENPTQDVDVFITSEQSVEDLKKDYPDAQCLMPDWVWECHSNKKLVSTTDYTL